MLRPLTRTVIGFTVTSLAVLTLLALAPRPIEQRLSTLHGDSLRIAMIYNRLANDPKPVDVAFVGSSHTVTGIDDKGIEDAIRVKGLHYSVANLGVPVVGRDMQIFIIHELVMHQRPKLIVLEINEHGAPKGHPYMPYVGDAADMFANGLPVNLPQMALLFLKQQWLGVVDSIVPGRSPAPSLPRAAYGWLPQEGLWSGRPNLVSAGERLEARLGPDLLKSLYRDASWYEDGSIDRIMTWTREHGVPVVFLYIPEFKYASDPDPELIRHYSHWAPVIVPPMAVVQDRNNWIDYSHLNTTGARKLAPFLSMRLGMMLNAPGAGRPSTGVEASESVADSQAFR